MVQLGLLTSKWGLKFSTEIKLPWNKWGLCLGDSVASHSHKASLYFPPNSGTVPNIQEILKVYLTILGVTG